MVKRIAPLVPDLYRKINLQVHWYGFNDLVTKSESYHVSLVKILCAINYDYTYPVIVYLLNGKLAELEQIIHTDVEYLNEVGITIYLNEPLSLENGTEQSPELDSILVYIKNNGLTNVTVHTCDYGCETKLPQYSQYMKLVTDDIFIKTISSTRASLPQNQFTKKFINLNWRYTDHRHLTAAFVSQLSSHFSWKYQVDDDVLNIYHWANVRELDEIFDGKLSNGLRYLNEDGPFSLDIGCTTVPVSNINSIHEIANASLSSNPQNIEHFYADAFCDVVTETKYDHPLGNISEKTLKPIGYRKPFVLVAPPLCLEYLRTLGYKTFSDFWDESYDTETNHQLRLIKIFKLLEYINSKSITDLSDLYDAMQPVLEHNARLLEERLPNKPMTKIISSSNATLRQSIWRNRIASKR